MGNLCDFQGSRFLGKKNNQQKSGGFEVWRYHFVCRNMPKRNEVSFFFQDSLLVHLDYNLMNSGTCQFSIKVARKSKVLGVTSSEGGKWGSVLKSYISESQVLA